MKTVMLWWVLVVGGVLGVGGGLAKRFLFPARIDWTNPELAPPAFSVEDGPHVFKPAETTPACLICGGGRLHSIHKVS